jgi:hypothetical protein
MSASIKVRNVIHGQFNPFPYTDRQGRQVIDETCACGHRRSDHFDTVAYGHAQCSICGECEKYTWMGFVYAP